jgi:hypothetical protein
LLFNFVDAATVKNILIATDNVNYSVEDGARHLSFIFNLNLIFNYFDYFEKIFKEKFIITAIV